MSGPSKMFSIVLPYKTYERLRAVAYESELSVGRAIRNAIDAFLKTRIKDEPTHRS